MPDTAWKAAERRICAAFGGARRGPDGKGQSDCVDTDEAIQIKYSKRGVPEGRWIDDAKRHGRNEKKPFVLVVAKPGQRVARVDRLSARAAPGREQFSRYDESLRRLVDQAWDLKGTPYMTDACEA